MEEKRERWHDLRQRVGRFLLIGLGCMLLAVAYNMIFDPCGMVTGGVSGLGIIVHSLTQELVPGGVPLWISNILFNAPIFILAWFVRGRKFVLDTAVGTLWMTVALYLVPTIDIVEGDKMLAAVFGGVLVGAGMGLVLRASCSTGGTDMLGLVISKFYHQHSVSEIIGFCDGCVVVLGALVFGIHSSLYAILAVFIFSKVSDFVLSGQNNAKMLHIISDCNERIAADILQYIERGVSGMNIRGMYTGADRTMLICVVSRKQLVPVKKVIHSHDPKAFVVVSNVSDVRGEGFIEDILDM